MKLSIRKCVDYCASGLAVLLVAASVVGAIIYAVQHGMSVLQELATGTLQGIGCAIGGLLGSALIMRFQTARDFLKNLLKDVK